MKHYLTGLKSKPINTLAIGVFDGMHLGHRSLTDKCDAILSFYPHPDRVLNKDNDIKSLTTPAELRDYHTHVVLLKFTRSMATLPPLQFLDLILTHIKPKKIVVGFDFRFGVKASGDFNLLQRWASQHNIVCEKISAKCSLNSLQPIKSSIIREYLTTSNFDSAIKLLGHSYLIKGRVIHGEGRGKSLGFPTANIQVPYYKLIPSAGVYGGIVQLRKRPYPAIVYIGTKPTFSGVEPSLEVHIPNQSMDLYGKSIVIELQTFIRSERKFDSSNSLIAQINKDIASLY